MEFDYYLIVQKKLHNGKIFAYKKELDGTEKMVPLFEGYQKATLIQSFRTADTIRKNLKIPKLTKNDLYVQKVTVDFGFELPNE